jgi:hypothetical protein
MIESVLNVAAIFFQYTTSENPLEIHLQFCYEI